MTTQMERLSRLMKLSWDIQKRKRSTRSKALEQAWAIVNDADITVFYLVSKLNHHKPVNHIVTSQFSLFTQ